MTDSAGAVVWNGEFKPFGEPMTVTGTITNNLRFPGQYFDSETGLHYNYFRDYKPQLGRYLEADPIGIKGGLNLYIYANNNTLSRVDLCGLADANTYTYGEIRAWAVTCSPSDLSSPKGLADAKASIGAACSRGNVCNSVDGSTATGKVDQAAWKNIVNATGGTDLSGGGNYMCTDHSCFITDCYKCCNGKKTRVKRNKPLQTTGSVTVSSCRGGTVYFYNDPNQFWCSREDYLKGCK